MDKGATWPLFFVKILLDGGGGGVVYAVSKSDGKEEETMSMFGSVFGKKGFGKGSPRFMNCLSARFSAGRGKDGRSGLFSRLNEMFSTAGAGARGMRPGRSGLSAAPKFFGRAVPLQIGGSPTRAPSPRRWGKQKGRSEQSNCSGHFPFSPRRAEILRARGAAGAFPLRPQHD